VTKDSSGALADKDNRRKSLETVENAPDITAPRGCGGKGSRHGSQPLNKVNYTSNRNISYALPVHCLMNETELSEQIRRTLA